MLNNSDSMFEGELCDCVTLVENKVAVRFLCV